MSTSNILSLVIVLGFGVWMLIRTLQNSDSPGTFAKKGLATILVVGFTVFFGAFFLSKGNPVLSAFVPVFTAAFCIVIGITWAPEAAQTLAKPLTGVFDGSTMDHEARPLYAIAEARRKRGYYEEAIAETEKQLQRFPGDLTGTLLLIDLHGKDLKAMAEAQSAVESYLEHGPHHPKNTFLALAHLADTYVEHHQNLDAARHCFQRIEQLCEGTEQALTAAQRIAHLGTEESLAERKEGRRIQLKTYDQRIGLRTESPIIARPEKTPEEQAQEYVEQLDAFPLDVEARENLALLYANHYGRLDMAMDQLDTLIGYPKQPKKLVAKWYNLKADLHVKIGGDIAAARAELESIRQKFPNTAHASQAEKRIPYLNLELKGRKASRPPA